MTVPDFYDDFVDYELTYLRDPNRRYRRVREHLGPLLERSPSAALDIGCGIGLISAWLARRVPRVVGVDVSPRSIEVSRQLHRSGEFRVCAVPDDPLPNGPFDLITFIDVLEHLPRNQLGLTFERVNEVAAEDGVVAINIPSRLFALKDGTDRQIIDAAVPIDEIVAAAAAIGMEPLSVSRYGVTSANQYVFCAFSRSYDVETRLRSGLVDHFQDHVWHMKRRLRLGSTGLGIIRRARRLED
jgi:SAM-dependent methyltransferase